MRFRELLKAKNQDNHGVRTPTIVFLGDSVTEGCFGFADDVRGSTDYEMVYHAQLKRMLQKLYGTLPLNIINAGIGGESSPAGLARLDRDVLRHQPDLVVVCFGLNDTGLGMERIDSYKNAMNAILARLKEENIETIVLTPNMMNTVPPHFHYPNEYEEYAAKIAGYMSDGTMDAYMQCARDAAAANGAYLCDVYAKWRKLEAAGVNINNLLDNKINHPTRQMHGLFAYSLFELIMFGD